MVVLADYRPKALSRWRVWGSAIVLAMLAFVAMLLLMRGLFESYAWPPDERQVERFLIAGRIVLGIAVASIAIGFLLRRSRNAIAATWLAGGMLVALVGFATWMNWSWPIP
jgi:hypothetical protein